MLHERIELLKADITQLDVEAIVNAANTTLLGGGGVDGSIHRAAGPRLLEECRRIGGCPTGDARLTKGYNLPAPWVIHTVGPIWNGGERKEEQLLASCYRTSLKIAEEKKLRSIAFPCISTGAYRFPIDQATKIAITQVCNHLKSSAFPEIVIFACFL
ncbi:MAG: O-acetyl-ADP-ribose deacetylase, partial [Bdellovibrionales bacterium]|nr:O-acetyl-ADP-ribose deacetylase [Bdellovibrionales bacterium]